LSKVLGFLSSVIGKKSTTDRFVESPVFTALGAIVRHLDMPAEAVCH
jgi:hypothetical protein